MARRGPKRKYHLTPELQATLVAWLEAGATLGHALSKAGLPQRTYQGWMERGEPVVNDLGEVIEPGEAPYDEFYRAVSKAKDAAELESLTKIRNEKRWQAHAWFLERTRPHDYAKRKVEHEHKVSGEINIVLPSNGRD